MRQSWDLPPGPPGSPVGSSSPRWMLLSGSCPLLPPGNESFPSSFPKGLILLPGPRPGSPPLLGEAPWLRPGRLSGLLTLPKHSPLSRGSYPSGVEATLSPGSGNPGFALYRCCRAGPPRTPLPHLQTGKLTPSSTWSVDRVTVSLSPQRAGCAGGWPCPARGAPGELGMEVAT